MSTAKEYVLNNQPSARCDGSRTINGDRLPHYYVTISFTDSCICRTIGIGTDEESAWVNAAENLALDLVNLSEQSIAEFKSKYNL